MNRSVRKRTLWHWCTTTMVTLKAPSKMCSNVRKRTLWHWCTTTMVTLKAPSKMCSNVRKRTLWHWCTTTMVTLKAPSKMCSRRHSKMLFNVFCCFFCFFLLLLLLFFFCFFLFCFFLFQRKQADDSHEMSRLVFSEKIKNLKKINKNKNKIVVCCRCDWRFKVCVVRMKTFCILGYPKCVQESFWSDCPNLRRAQMSKGTFLEVAALIYVC